jgi:hypothetical protein
MLSQSLLQLRALILHPAPDRCVIDMETTLFQQFLNIAQRQRIAKIPPYRTNYEAGFGLTPFEDRGSGYHFAILSRHQPAALKVATHPHERKTREQANPKPNCTVCEGSMWVVNSAKTARPMPIVASAGTGGSRDSRLPAVDRSAIAARLSKSAGNYFACPSGNERRKMVPFLPRT